MFLIAYVTGDEIFGQSVTVQLRIGPKLITASALDSIAVLPEGKVTVQ